MKAVEINVYMTPKCWSSEDSVMTRFIKLTERKQESEREKENGRERVGEKESGKERE